MTLKAAKRSAIEPFIVMDVMRQANAREAQGEDVLHLEVGQPSTSAPRHVLKAAQKAIDSELLGYTDAFGVPLLKEAIAKHYLAAYDITIDPSQVAVTTGSSGGFVLAFLSAFDAGDRVALASPGYPAYRNILKALDIEVVNIEVGPKTNYQPTPELLSQIKGDLAGLIIASPSNPTGTMIDDQGLKNLADYCHDRGVRIISDEIYHGITYENKASSMAQFSSDAFVVNSFSKYYSMTGWRLGWLIFPQDLSRPIECLAQNLFISPPTLSQIAAVSAFDCEDELKASVKRYKVNRDILLKELPKAGFKKLSHAEGAFYIYADVSDLTNDSLVFCQYILTETGVAITPGVDFDVERGHQFVRFSFAGTTADIKMATTRLQDLNIKKNANR